ncbi:MAG: DUF2070 family protein [Candidatus Korarchaeota archaeon]|nr:DUF2070 family protein [Thermoproteota archaeon]
MSENEMKEINRLYRLMFLFPSLKSPLFTLMAQFSIYFVILWNLYRVDVTSIDVYILTVAAVFMPLLLLKLPQEVRALNRRRALAVSNILLGFLNLILILTLLRAWFCPIFLCILSVLELYIVLGLVNWGIWKSAFFVFSNVSIISLSLIRSTNCLTAQYNPTLNFITPFAKVTLLIALVILTALAIIYSNEKIWPTTNKIGTLKLVRAFLMLKLDRKRDEFEKILERMSIDREIPVAITAFRSKDRKEPLFAIVGAQIHPGPLLNSGSSDFPEILFREMKNRLKIPTLFLKGASSHDANLPSLAEQFKLLDVIEREIRCIFDENFWYDEICEPEILNNGSLHITKLSLGNQTYLLASNAPQNSDDLETSLGYFAMELGHMSGKNVFLVDAHNSLSEPVEGLVLDIDSKEYHMLGKLIRNAITKVCEPKKFMIGVDQCKCEQVKPKDGLGGLGIVAIAMKIGQKLHVLITYDSNNINPKFYLDMKEKIREEFGAESVELLSTDTHTVCALDANKLYTILGEKKGEILKECTIQTVRKAIENLTEAEVSNKAKVINLRVLGRNNAAAIKGLSIVYVKVFIRDMLLSFALSVLLSLLAILV